MNDLIITKQQEAVIQWNKVIATTEAKAIMAKYKGLQLTDEQISDAKTELASLRKVSTAINKQAIDIEKELTKNVKFFRDEVKELKAIIDDGIAFIDKQVKDFEQKEKDDKKAKILALEEYDNIKEFIQFDDKWLNKTVSINKIIDELNFMHNTIQSDISTIKKMCENYKMKNFSYIERLKTETLSDVLNRIMEDAKLVNTVIEEIKVEEKPVVVEAKEYVDGLITITRVITGTKEQLIELKRYAVELGVEYNA